MPLFLTRSLKSCEGVGAHGTTNTLGSIPMKYVLRILLLTLVAVLFLFFVVN